LRAVGGHDDAYHGGRPTAETVPDVAWDGLAASDLAGRPEVAASPDEQVVCLACVGSAQTGTGGSCPRCEGSGVEPDLPAGEYVVLDTPAAVAAFRARIAAQRSGQAVGGAR